MGIDYSFQVYVHQRNAGRLLAAVAALCDPHKEATTAVLPDGTSVALPGTYGWKAGRTVRLTDVVGDRDRSSFDLSLCFPEDAPLQVYRDDETHKLVDPARAWPDGSTRVMMGYIYLSIFDGSSLLPDHWVFDFTPATSVQSQLFLSSPSIRETFAAIAFSVAAPLCLFDVEERYKIVVTARDRRVSTQVPGPCVLWDRCGPKDQAYHELLVRLAGQTSATTPRWIIGPEHQNYGSFVASLTRDSGATGAVY